MAFYYTIVFDFFLRVSIFQFIVYGTTGRSGNALSHVEMEPEPTPGHKNKQLILEVANVAVYLFLLKTVKIKSAQVESSQKFPT